MTITEIQEKLKNHQFEISVHAFEEAVDDDFSLSQIIDAVITNGKVIERRVENCRCLVHCKSHQRHIHAVFDYYDCVHGLCVEIELVTVYEPDRDEWIDHRKRRK